MRIAVVSDVHGNCVALDEVLADIQKSSIDKIVCLGDTIEGGPQPKETVERMRALSCPIVMGNTDAWLLDVHNETAEPASPEQSEVRAWALSKLSPSDLAFIRSYRPTVEFPVDDKWHLLCFHGSPLSYNDVLLPDTPWEEWVRMLGPFGPAIMAGGHTHTQQVRRIGIGVFFNPGSVGLAYNYYAAKEHFLAESWAEYCILSSEFGRIGLDFRRVPFNLEELIRVARQSGRPHAEQFVADYRTPSN
jgi:predicted phosphodiesterase